MTERQTPPFTLDVERRPGYAIVSLAGELDLLHAPMLEERLHNVESHRPETLVIDLSDLEFLDSSGIAVLIGAHLRSQEAGRRLVMIPGSRLVQKVFATTGLDRVFDFQQSRDDAVPDESVA